MQGIASVRRTVRRSIEEIKRRIAELQKPELDKKIDEMLKEVRTTQKKVQKITLTLFKGVGRSIGKALRGFRGVGRGLKKLLRL